MGAGELTGVLAHEISHLRNGDTRFMVRSDVVGRFGQLLSYVGLWSMALTVPMSVATQEPVLVLVSALLPVVPTLVTLLQLAMILRASRAACCSSSGPVVAAEGQPW